MKNFALPNVLSNEILRLAGKISNKNLLRAVDLLERVASIEWHHRGIDAIKKMIEEDHQGIQATRRILQKANPRARSALLNNLVLGCLLLGYRKRLEFYNRYGVAPPGTLMISPTFRCNLSCHGCATATHEKSEELSFEEVDRILSDATESGTNFIIMLGGEPFILPWLLDMVEKYPHMAFQIYSNGLLIDDEKVERLALLGNAAVAINVDGLQAETDGRKGAGTFDKVMEVMRKLSEAGVIVGFSAMTSRSNFDVIYSDTFIDTMIKNGAGYGWIPIALPQGSACQEPDLIPTKEQKSKIKGLIEDLRQRKPILLMDFLNDADITEGCSAARLVMHINASGDVEPCILMPFAADNIKEKSFKDIIRSDFFKGVRDISHRHCDETQTCLWVYKPKDVLEVVKKCGARVTSEGVMEKLNELAIAQEEE
jgi:MoaA/NifB/PqqE/SkfB family radical SAM enzyme